VICRRFKDSTVEDQPISPLAHEVRFAPKADKSLHRSEMTRCAITGREQMQQRPCVSERQSLDHLIGALLEYPRHIEAKRLGGLEIKH
jgi:hypothetical protein